MSVAFLHWGIIFSVFLMFYIFEMISEGYTSYMKLMMSCLLIISLVFASVYLLLIKSFLIIPFIIYFTVGYLVSIQFYPKLDIPMAYKYGFTGVCLVMDIIMFYPIILGLNYIQHLKSKKQNLLFPIKTPFSESRKREMETNED